MKDKYDIFIIVFIVVVLLFIGICETFLNARYEPIDQGIEVTDFEKDDSQY